MTDTEDRVKRIDIDRCIASAGRVMQDLEEQFGTDTQAAVIVMGVVYVAMELGGGRVEEAVALAREMVAGGLLAFRESPAEPSGA